MWHRMYSADQARTYYLGQTAMISFDLVRDVLGLDEGGPEEDKGVGRTRNV
jgi:hypothetical protein